MALADGVQVVRIDHGNARLLDDVTADVFDHDVDHALLMDYLRSGQLLVVATHEHVVVGQIQAMVQHHVDGPPQLYIDNLGVAPSHRRQGIARALIGEITAWSIEHGCVETWLVTDIDNDEANSLYHSLGADRSDVVLYSID